MAEKKTKKSRPLGKKEMRATTGGAMKRVLFGAAGVTGEEGDLPVMDSTEQSAHRLDPYKN